MASVSSSDTVPSIGNRATTVIHIHGDVTIKFHTLTINNGALGTAATDEASVDEHDHPNGDTTTEAQNVPDAGPEAPGVQPDQVANLDNGDEAENNLCQLPSNLIIHAEIASPEILDEDEYPTTNGNGRNLYSTCRRARCGRIFKDMFAREEHEVKDHFFCGDCQRTFISVTETQQVRFEPLRLHS